MGQTQCKLPHLGPRTKHQLMSITKQLGKLQCLILNAYLTLFQIHKLFRLSLPQLLRKEMIKKIT